MIYLLYKLERLSFKSIDEYSPVNAPSSIDKIHKETLAVKKRLKGLFFEPYIEQSFETFTNAHHKALIRLLNEIKGRHPERAATVEDRNSFISFINDLTRAVEDLLSFLHQYYQKYLDPRELLPATFKETAIAEAREMLVQIGKSLKYLDRPELTRVLIKPFCDFILSPRKNTFHNLFYCRILYKEILINSKSPGLYDYDQMISMLIYMNCNSNWVHVYITRHITENSDRNELENLYLWLKRIRQSRVRPGTVYKIQNPTLSSTLEKWIEEEIRFFEKAAQIRVENSKHAGTAGLAIKEKIISDLSVAELALYYKLLIELKFIKVGNQQEFFRTLSAMFRTKHTETISMESLRTKFYNPDSSTKRSVKEKVIKVLNHINSMN